MACLASSVDRFGDVVFRPKHLALECTNGQGLLLPMLANQMGLPALASLRTSPQFLSQEGCDPPPLMSEGCPLHVVISEHGTRFQFALKAGTRLDSSVISGKTTGRTSRRVCQGRSVLDLCCYTGGFSVQAKLLGKAVEVTGVDLDEEPLRLARENANLDQVRAKFVQWEYLYIHAGDAAE